MEICGVSGSLLDGNQHHEFEVRLRPTAHAAQLLIAELRKNQTDLVPSGSSRIAVSPTLNKS
jgi:hypothetical protein